jgi:hypothetical protein
MNFKNIYLLSLSKNYKKNIIHLINLFLLNYKSEIKRESLK